MSHVATVELEVRDLDALEEAGRRLGLQLVRGQQTYKWWGRSVGDYPIPDGFSAEDLGKCEHALHSDSAAYEVGVVRRRDGRPGWQLLWDFIDGRLVNIVGHECRNLKREYAAIVAAKQAQRQGFRVQEQRLPNGGIKLLMSR